MPLSNNNDDDNDDDDEDDDMITITLKHTINATIRGLLCMCSLLWFECATLTKVLKKNQ